MSLYFKCLYIILLFLITINAPAQERLALVIGNSDYQDGKDLKNPVNDAKDLAAVLSQLDFKVIHKNNLNLEEMEQTINQFGSKLRKSGGVGLFYFSGHGVQHKGANYLIPIGAMRSLSVSEQLRYKTVNANYVLAAMKAAKNELNIVILDACRDNPFKSLFKGLGKIVSDGLVETQKSSDFLIAYATAPGKVAIDGNGDNSPYVKHLMAKLLTPNVEIEQILKQVRVAVKKETNGIQEPAYYAAIDQDFYFNPTKPDKVEEKVSPKVVTPIESKQVASASSSSFVEKLTWVMMIVIVILFIMALLDNIKTDYPVFYILMWLALFMPNLALGLEFLPNSTKTFLPEVYLSLNVGLCLASWLFIMIFDYEENTCLGAMIVMIMTMIEFIIIFGIFAADGVIGVAACIGFLSFFIIELIKENLKNSEENFENSKKNLEDSIFSDFFLLLLIADNIFLIYYCFFDGWKLFV